MAREVNVMVVERGVSVRGSAAPEDLVLKQRSGESAREFAHRVQTKLAEVQASGARVPRASLKLSSARGPSADARRFSLARALLTGLPDSDELSIGGPLGQSEQGKLDIDALAETLELFGTSTVVSRAPRTVAVGATPAFWPRAA